MDCRGLKRKREGISLGEKHGLWLNEDKFEFENNLRLNLGVNSRSKYKKFLLRVACGKSEHG